MRDVYELPPHTYAPSAKFQRSLGWLDAVADSMAGTERDVVEHATRIARQALAEADAMALENERMRECITRQIDNRMDNNG